MDWDARSTINKNQEGGETKARQKHEYTNFLIVRSKNQQIQLHFKLDREAEAKVVTAIKRRTENSPQTSNLQEQLGEWYRKTMKHEAGGLTMYINFSALFYFTLEKNSCLKK